jgi:hypothetical protein
MFEPKSRYYNIENAKLTVIEGDDLERIIVYKRRRFIPPIEGTVTLVEHTVLQGDRLDNLTARYLGDPEAFWRVCDANNVLRPDDLEQVGRVVAFALPQMTR